MLDRYVKESVKPYSWWHVQRPRCLFLGSEDTSFHQSNLPLLRENLHAGASTDIPAGSQDMFLSPQIEALVF